MLSGSTCSTSGTFIVCFLRSITILSGNLLVLLELNSFGSNLSSFICSKILMSTLTDDWLIVSVNLFLAPLVTEINKN